MEDPQFRILLQHLGLSWTGFRKVRKGVKKRICRHMQRLNCPNMGEYLLELERSSKVRSQCECLMTVSISRFFRDKGMWEALRKEILPGLIKTHVEKISIWSAGCASGEEVYSLKILWDTLIFPNTPLPELSITATDMNPIYLKRARDGIYPLSSLKEVPEHFLSKYFKPEGGGKRYSLKASLRNGISWQIHNLLFSIPESKFQIIFLRNNLLTYYEDEVKESALKNLLTHLCPSGFLIIGSHEKLPFETSELHHYGAFSYIFKKQD
ncbi:MAG: hypothetical protein ISS63_03535 [Desulfobacteraceae bacterium]|nr:hypothetical protein [Desulfobacteraceae bacterium]